MDSQRAKDNDRSGPTGGGPFLWRNVAFWVPACMVLGLPVAWAADVAQSYFAPLVIFPLLVGVCLGAMTVGLVRLMQVGHRPTVVAGTVLAALVTVLGQHYADYRNVCRRAQADAETYQDAKRAFPDKLRGRVPEAPSSFGDFLRQKAAHGRNLDIWGYRAKGFAAWLTWATDGLLLLAAALAVVIPATRQPYCRRCRSWYRVIHSGRVDRQTVERLIEVTEVPVDDRPASARYRLVGCQGGCGPVGFALSWERSKGDVLSIQAWLDAERRNRVIEVLEETDS